MQSGLPMLFVREYPSSGPSVVALHGGPGASGHMAPVARGLAASYRVVEPFQRRSGSERLTVATHVADLHEVIEFYAAGSRPALLGASWGAMLRPMPQPTQVHPDHLSLSGVELSILWRAPSCKARLSNG
jgi:hypothetical protein